jgi:hypothetical protein
MVWYVALVAIMNLGLGYALAVYLGANRRRDSWRSSVVDSGSVGQLAEDDEYGFDHSDDYLADERDFARAGAR